MKKRISLLYLLASLLIIISFTACQKSTTLKRYIYPDTKQKEVVENYHGTMVKDPFRWLEDSGSPEVKAWIAEENKVTFAYLAGIPARKEIKERLTTLYNYPRYKTIIKKGNRCFFEKNDGLQNQYVIYQQEGMDSEPILVMDPNSLSEDGTVAVTDTVINKNGTLMVYALSTSGSDRQELKIRSIDTGKDYEEVLKWCKFSTISWSKNNDGFFYNHFPEAGTVPVEDENNFNRVYWHKLDTPQSEDKLIYEQPDEKELIFQPQVSDDQKYLILEVFKGTDPVNRLYYRELNGEGEFIKLLIYA